MRVPSTFRHSRMKAARPGRWEYEVEAAIEYWYMKNGAMSWGYPSIVGSGPNATRQGSPLVAASTL